MFLLYCMDRKCYFTSFSMTISTYPFILNNFGSLNNITESSKIKYSIYLKNTFSAKFLAQIVVESNRTANTRAYNILATKYTIYSSLHTCIHIAVKCPLVYSSLHTCIHVAVSIHGLFLITHMYTCSSQVSIGLFLITRMYTCSS